MKRLFTIAILLMGCLIASGQSRFYTSEKLSSNQITHICQDKVGYLWVGTEFGLNKYDGYRYSTYLHDKNKASSLSSNIISSLFVDTKGNLWVGTQKGLDLFDPQNEHFEHVVFEEAKDVPRVNDIIQEDDEHLLVGTTGYGLFRLDVRDRKTKKLSGYALGENAYFSHIFLDSEGAFWKSGHGNQIVRRSPDGSLQEFESPYGTVTDYVEYEGGVVMVCIHGLLYYRDGVMHTDYFDQSGISCRELFLRTAMTDRRGNLFVGTMGNGLYWVPRGDRRFRRYVHQSASLDLNTTNVWALFEDSQDNLWVGCQKRGLLMLPQQSPLFRSWKFADMHMNVGGSLTSLCDGGDNIVWCSVQNNGVFGIDGSGSVVAHPSSPEGTYVLYRDHSGRYWVGTNGCLYAYNPLTGQSELKVRFNNGFINAITDDGKSLLFFSVFGEGFCSYDTVTGAVRRFSMHQDGGRKGRLHNDWLSRLFVDSRGKLWICTASGVNCYDPVEDHFHPYGWEVVLDYHAVESVCETSDRQLLLGTATGLFVYDPKKKEAVPFPGAEALADKVVSNIVEDDAGDLWCSTTVGIWHYQRHDKTFVSYMHGNGLLSREYVNGVSMHTPDDRVWFGFSDGITSFSPEALRTGHYSLGQVHLTGFFIGGSNAVNANTLSDGKQVVSGPVDGSDYFSLSYLDNTFTMEFSTLNYSNAESISYEYRINGASEWTRTTDGSNSVSFHHLQPGSYAIEVRAVENGLVTEPHLYHVVVRPPWYLSSYAYIIYILLLLSLAVLAVWGYRRRARRQLDEDKMEFLINATHDIRSPLTLIMSPLHKLMKRNLDSDVMEQLKTIEHNASRVQNLVNQILDIRKIDKQQMKLHCQETDIVQYVGNILKSYEYTASERGISLSFLPEIDKLNVWLDRNALDKLLDNLLSNAFKYTFDRGEISVHISQPDAKTAELQVVDNGMGIKGDVRKIFDRFYQGPTSRSMHIEGTGIGLNLCKMIVSMHHGTIEASSRRDSQGSVFTVRLPLGVSHLSKEELLHEEAEHKSHRKSQSSYRVLIVDDDTEIGSYILQELGGYYYITAVTSGREAFRKLMDGVHSERQYDLVVSDVMMPEMDGFTLLRMIKTNMNISHIPVVMLTSKADVGNRLEGLEKGADAYLAKPFDMDELHMVINNLINKNLRLKGKYSGTQQQKDKVEEKVVKGNDERLMERIMKVINEHLSDSDFNVEMLCEEVGISRAQLHRKMKQLTGVSTSEFIRNLRLEQAARLIREKKLNISQVTYSVGFNNQAHFSTVFKKYFSVTPTEYAERDNSSGFTSSEVVK